MERGLLGFEAVFGFLARLPLQRRRKILRILFHMSALIGRPWRSGLAPHFQKILRLPRQVAVRLDREAAFVDWLAELEWLSLLRRRRAGLLKDLATIRVDHPEALRMVASAGRPVVLAPLHMGAYTACLAELIFRFFPGRPLLILRRRDDMPLETRVMERIRDFGIDMRFLNVTDRANYLAAMRFGRKGAVIVVFCDLPPSYGMPAAMPMFGQPMRFAFGLDAIARLLDAAVLPLQTIARTSFDEVRVGEPFEVFGGDEEARRQAAGRIGRHIAAALEQTPEQWHLWPTLAEYLPSADTVAPQSPSEEPAPLPAVAPE